MPPHVRYKINKQLDAKMALVFWGWKTGGIDFTNNIIGVHPELKILKNKSKILQKKIINSYFDAFYKKHTKYLKGQIKKTQSGWNKVEKRYFKEVTKIFRNHSFPKGKYWGYLSILNCNPRFLNNKTFQFFYYRPQWAIFVTAHELLHFIFYDYCLKKYPKIFKRLNPNCGLFWDLAEIFNTIILTRKEFEKIHQVKGVVSYPKHKKIVKKIERKYQDKKIQLDDLIKDILKELKKTGV
jgi:hypothetical protein